MQNLVTYQDFRPALEAAGQKYDAERRDFLTGLATTFGLLPLTGWGIYRVARALADDYRGVDQRPRWAAGLTLSGPGRKFLERVYKAGPGLEARISGVEDMLHREFEELERREEDLELTQRMYDAIVMAGVRVGAEELSRSAFMANVRAGDFAAAAKSHGWLEGGQLEGDAARKAAEFESELFLSRSEIGRAGVAAAGHGADMLRDALGRLGYREKGGEISSGGPVTPELARAVSEVLGRFKAEMPDVMVTVTAGNDRFHRRFARSQHKHGRAVDLVIDPYDRETAAAFTAILDEYRREDPKFRYLDEYRTPSAVATGGHFHLQYR